MAEFEYMDDHDGRQGDGHGSRFGKWVNLSGAVVSLALIGGLSVWGYQLLMRDVNGVPVVQAMEGAFRVAPEDPGGMQAPHQGLAVNEIAAEGEAGGPAEEVTLAPAPTGLADEDVPADDLQQLAAEEEEARIAEIAAAEREAEQRAEAEAARQAAEAEVANLMDGEDTSTALVEDAEPEAGIDLSDTEVADEDAAPEADLPDGALATDMAVAQALSSRAESDFEEDLPVPGTGITSPRPEPRPARASVATGGDAAPQEPQVASGTASEVAVDELATGTRLVQLGAFASDEGAREEWARIASRFPDYFDGKRRVVQAAQSGGKTFYRLRAEGFTDLADTRRFCTELLARQTDCIPVELQ
ncbi:SPOR domain-containing protein [Palleronia sp. LCG004]|uniref:SPOR domain-containing protein n=1 Tax=Palleronia sp. LCG004 TaxID=3079304 RepID=UPI002943386B|nr:SPOR domain-containing protein [Palleronia sp. LCG004]WOI57154.1 SPOR domain-containing protein [Palleronia sp. LCG004]